MPENLEIPAFLDRRRVYSARSHSRQDLSNSSFKELHKHAEGRWEEILTALGIPSTALSGKHQPCPGCGGKDRFRFDNDKDRGTFFCSGGGSKDSFGDGFEFLMHAGIAKTPQDARKMVSQHLGIVEGQLPSADSAAPPRVIPYEYRDAKGVLQFTVTRTEHGNSKLFSQKTARGLSPKHDSKFKALPYRLPELLNQPDATVLIVEGEKCVDRLSDIGFIATCNHGGAGNWTSKINQYFENRDLVILPDNDESGERHCRTVIDQLRNTAASIRVCKLPNLPPKGDIVDWLDAGNKPSSLAVEIENANPVDDGLGFLLAEFLDRKIEIPEPIHDHLPAGFTMLAGSPKAGKSAFAEALASEINGAEPVVYCALEYNEPMAQQRFEWMPPEATKNIRLFLEGSAPRMGEGGEEWLERLLEQLKPRLTVIDTLARFKKQAAERGYEAETEAMAGIKAIFARHRLACLCIHHTRKRSINDADDDPFERILGSTALAAVPDNLMVLQLNDRQTVLHTKGRLIERSIKRFDFKNHRFVLRTDPGAALEGVADVQALILKYLSEKPANQREIASALKLDAGNVSRYCRALSERGKIGRSKKGQPWKIKEPIPAHQ